MGDARRERPRDGAETKLRFPARRGKGMLRRRRVRARDPPCAPQPLRALPARNAKLAKAQGRVGGVFSCGGRSSRTVCRNGGPARTVDRPFTLKPVDNVSQRAVPLCMSMPGCNGRGAPCARRCGTLAKPRAGGAGGGRDKVRVGAGPPRTLLAWPSGARRTQVRFARATAAENHPVGPASEARPLRRPLKFDLEISRA